MIEKLFGTEVTIVTLKSEQSLKGLRDAVLNKHPGIMFLEDNNKPTYPHKYTLIYDWDYKTCSLVAVDEEFVV